MMASASYMGAIQKRTAIKVQAQAQAAADNFTETMVQEFEKRGISVDE